MADKRCPFCNKLNDEDNTFCIFCGEKFHKYPSDEDGEGVSYEETMDMFY